MPNKKGKFQPTGVGMTPSRTELGSFIRARRLELDLRQVFLAKQVGPAQRSISSLEIGTWKYPNDDQLEKLAKALQCDPEELRKRMSVKPSSQPKTELGKLIRSRREELGLTLEDFAKKMRIPCQKAKYLEIRKSPSLGYGLVEPLARVLNLEPLAFVEFIGITRKPTTSDLGRLVRRRRKELAMSISQLAKKLRVSQQYVNQIEFGQCRLSKNDNMIERLSQVLKLDVNELQAVRPKPKPKLKERETPLGNFLTKRRLELHLSQMQVAQRAKTFPSHISQIERGDYCPGRLILERISKALECEIPADFIPQPRPRGRPRARIMQDTLRT